MTSMPGQVTSARYLCVNCDHRFEAEGERKPRCPKCMRKNGVEALRAASQAPQRSTSARWFIGALVAACACGAGYFLWSTVLQEDYTKEPPLRPLNAKSLDGYGQHAGVEPNTLSSIFVVDASIAELAESAGDSPSALVEEIHARVIRRNGNTWPADTPLARPVYSPVDTLKALDEGSGVAMFYPVEIAVLSTVALRERGDATMVAEVWGFEGDRSPPDPSGAFGYFVIAVYEDEVGEGAPTFLDPYGGRTQPPDAARVRVLKDTEVAAAVLGANALHANVHGGDRASALAKVQQGLRLDPRSPGLRNVHASILMESGGFEEAIKEVESALQLRPEAPQQVNMAQVHLTQASLFEMNGETSAATREVETATQRIASALEAEPEFARAHLAMAMIRLATDEKELARVSLENAERFGPNASALPLIWAQYFIEEGETDRALEYIERAIERHPDNWKLRLHAAQLLASTGRYEEVRRQIQKALELAPAKDRAALRAQVGAALGPVALGDDAPATGGGLDAPDLDLGGSQSGTDPALMLGDPSKLRLRDPGQELQLDLDE